MSDPNEEIGSRFATIGQRHRDGMIDVGAVGDRSLFHVDVELDLFDIDPDVQMVGDPSSGYTLTAPFTEAWVMTTTTSRITCPGRGWVIDQHALLTRAFETGERSLRLSDFLMDAPRDDTAALQAAIDAAADQASSYQTSFQRVNR